MGSCATCQVTRSSIVTIDRLGVPHGAPGHQVNYRWTCVYACPTCASGLLVHFDHDCFAPPWEDPWDRDWTWQVAPDGIRRLHAALAGCPDPAQASCACPVHQSFRTSYESATPRRIALTIVLTDEGLPELRALPAGQSGS